MANLTVKSLGLINPFIIASSPATQGVWAALKSASARPGAIVMRNFGHGAGGGSLTLPSVRDMAAGRDAIQSHAMGLAASDGLDTLERYCQAVSQVRREMPSEVKLWVSIGQYADTVRPGVDWEHFWVQQAVEVQKAGADALEVHFNTPGVAAARRRIYDFDRLVYNTTRMIKEVARVPVMVKLPVEGCDPLRAMEAAMHGGADAIGPTARWKAFTFDLDWRRSLVGAGSGYGGTQALPIICYTVAEARMNGIQLPMFAGGGAFSWQAAAKLIMAGSQAVQLGSLACCLGPRAVSRVIKGLGEWMDAQGISDMESLTGQALNLFTLPRELAQERVRRLGAAYKDAAVNRDLCSGCGDCAEACWYAAIALEGKKAVKKANCIGCGYCFQVCPTGALRVEAGEIVASVFE
jgi:dihydroorotate dehydrogenase/NAD-dependent dihydropyrimidine dehydrogenase PreA subunit